MKTLLIILGLSFSFNLFAEDYCRWTIDKLDCPYENLINAHPYRTGERRGKKECVGFKEWQIVNSETGIVWGNKSFVTEHQAQNKLTELCK